MKIAYRYSFFYFEVIFLKFSITFTFLLVYFYYLPYSFYHFIILNSCLVIWFIIFRCKIVYFIISVCLFFRFLFLLFWPDRGEESQENRELQQWRWRGERGTHGGRGGETTSQPKEKDATPDRHSFAWWEILFYYFLFRFLSCLLHYFSFDGYLLFIHFIFFYFVFLQSSGVDIFCQSPPNQSSLICRSVYSCFFFR